MPTAQATANRADRLVDEIETAIRSGDRVMQSRLVQESAEMLVKRWSRLPPTAKDVFDGLLFALLGQVDTAARQLFALKLAELRLPPARTAAMLSRDPSADVAMPLLSRSRALDAELLGSVIETCSDRHRLAVASRVDLDMGTTDALIAQNAPAVAVGLLDNPAAPISEAGFDGLMRLAAASEAVAVRLGARAGLPGRCRAPLLALARQRAAEEVELVWSDDRARAASVQAEVPAIFERPLDALILARFAASANTDPEEFAPAVATSARLERWIALRRIEDVLAALSYQAGLPVEATVRAYLAPSASGLCAILRGLQRPWSLLKSLLLYRHAEDVPVAHLREVYDLFEALTPLAARRLARLAMLPRGHAAFADRRWPELAEPPRDS
ncbi:DUF2336 domain-containing protein [Methylobacterium sp. sgz302541]|uniref:DUF2336 domain-containing protein n=1 Tax=unclassified Methylobacterium TaxID=2615210 RepID=UPI003D32A754